MSLKANDVWARLNLGNILDPDLVPLETVKQDGWDCGQAEPRYMNWVLYRLSQSAVKSIQEWNTEVAAYGGYVHPAWVTGSDGSIYRSLGVLSDLTSDPVTDGGINWANLFSILIPYPPRYVSGLYWINNLANPTTDIDVGLGAALLPSINAENNSVLTKKLNVAWTLGAGGGLRGTGVALAASTDYSLHIIAKPDGTVDFEVDTAANAANPVNLIGVGGAAVAAGFTQAMHIGWVQTDAGSLIVRISRDGDYVKYRGVDLIDALNPVDNTAVTSRCPPDTLVQLHIMAQNTGAAAAGLQCAIKVGQVGDAIGVPSNVDNSYFAQMFNSTGNFTGASAIQIFHQVNSAKQFLQRFANTGGASNIRYSSKGYIFNRVRN